MDNKEINFPYYSGNIHLTKCLGLVSLDRFIYAHKNPSNRTKDILEKIKECELSNDKEGKRSYKQMLFSFTPSVIIPINLKRKYVNIKSFTGLMQIDFDKIPDLETALDLKQFLFETYKQIVTIYISPSGKGVKGLLRIKIPRDLKHYKAMHKAVSLEMEQFGYFDDATNNAILPLFLSQDDDILYRDISKCDVWTEENWEVPEYVELNDKPTNFKRSYDFNENYREKTIRIFTNKIVDIIDNGHPQVRSACLILGSRVGAGYISEFEAVGLAENLINSNGYLKKDLSNYKRTARWCISEGLKNPKFYK